MNEKTKKFLNHLIASYPIVFFGFIITIIVALGTIFFHIVEGRDLFNAFYFTTVTMSTIGYGDMAPVTHGGKIIAIIYGFMGAPLFIGLTGLFFQNKFQNLVKTSIHNYHREIKEAEKMATELQKENEIQKEKIEEIKEELHPKTKKKHRRKIS